MTVTHAEYDVERRKATEGEDGPSYTLPIIVIILLIILLIVSVVFAVLLFGRSNDHRDNDGAIVKAPTPNVPAGTMFPAKTQLNPLKASTFAGSFTDQEQDWDGKYADGSNPETQRLAVDYTNEIIQALSPKYKPEVSIQGFSPAGPNKVKVQSLIAIPDSQNPDSKTVEELLKKLPHWTSVSFYEVTPSGHSSPLPPLPPKTTDGWKRAAAILESSMDWNVDPCDDFYKYSCGNWEKKHKLPPHKDQIIGFDILQDDVLSNLSMALDKVSSGSARALQQSKLAYDICMKAAETKYDGSHILAQLKAYNGWPIIDPDWSGFKPEAGAGFLIGQFSSLFRIDSIFTLLVDVDWGHVQPYVLSLDQATLYYPTSYYTTPAAAATFLPQLKALINKTAHHMAKLAKVDVKKLNIDRDVQELIDFEVLLANISTPQNLKRNFTKMNNPTDINLATQNYPKLQLRETLRAAAQSSSIHESLLTNRFIVFEPEYMKSINAAWPKDRLLANYLLWRLVAAQSEFMPELKTSFQDFKSAVDGMKDVPPRVLKCAGDVMMYVPFAAGRLYTEIHFEILNPNTRAIVSSMISNVVNAFQGDFVRLPWIDQYTRENAVKKVEHLIQNVAFPDWVLNDKLLDAAHPDSFLQIAPQDDYITVWMKLRRFQGWFQYNQLLKESVDRTDFQMSPSWVNAWYNPWLNSITFPASILNPPFFDSEFPMAVNYGGIGVVLGHELTHGFDDQGVQFGPEGALLDWMDSETDKGFKKMAECVVDEYSRFCYENVSLCLNGRNTQGENIADNGGIKSAYNAYQARKRLAGPERPLPGKMSEFTMEQIFFLSFGQVWCSITSEAKLRNQILSNVHSPPESRINGTIQNFPAFARAFGCKQGDREAPKDHCTVW